jgi:hypothetical protein
VELRPAGGRLVGVEAILVGGIASYWTSTTYEATATYAYRRRIQETVGTIGRTVIAKSGVSRVRCLAD